MSLILARTLLNKFYKEKFDTDHEIMINSDHKLISPHGISFNYQTVCNENMRNDARGKRS